MELLASAMSLRMAADQVAKTRMAASEVLLEAINGEFLDVSSEEVQGMLTSMFEMADVDGSGGRIQPHEHDSDF